MGGGAAMRAAGKVAGVGVATSGIIRGGLSSVSSPAEQSVRNAKRPVSALISSSSSQQQQNKVEMEGFQQAQGFDDWEMAGGFEELEEQQQQLIGPLPRLVFGGPPSLEEAKAATNEVKDALEKVYMSSPAYTGSVLETKSCITSDARSTDVVKAFKFLNQSPQAQTVVASIATDKNVWDAVFKNEALQDYLLSEKTNAELQGSPRLSSVSSDDASQVEKVENGPIEILKNIKHSVVLKNIKHTVADMAHKVSTFVQQIFGYTPSENISAADDANARPSFSDKTLGASLMALVVMVIMVVVLKRG